MQVWAQLGSPISHSSAVTGVASFLRGAWGRGHGSSRRAGWGRGVGPVEGTPEQQAGGGREGRAHGPVGLSLGCSSGLAPGLSMLASGLAATFSGSGTQVQPTASAT